MCTHIHIHILVHTNRERETFDFGNVERIEGPLPRQGCDDVDVALDLFLKKLNLCLLPTTSAPQKGTMLALQQVMSRMDRIYSVHPLYDRNDHPVTMNRRGRP